MKRKGMENSEYFQERIQSMRRRLHAMEGFEGIENISENITEPQQKTNSKQPPLKEKESHEK